MNTYVILRRAGWSSAEQLQAAAPRSKQVGENMSDDIRWIRSYVVSEPAGAVGTVCIYQATSPEAIRQHAATANVPVDEILEVVDTVVLQPDPVTVAS
jgi:Nickel responsive protein SCO4226-like